MYTSITKLLSTLLILTLLQTIAINAMAFDTETEDATETISVQGSRPMWDLIDEMFTDEVSRILSAYNSWDWSQRRLGL